MRKVERVDRVCQQCGRHFTTTPSRIRDGRGKFCSHKCHNSSQMGRQLSDVTRQRMSLAHKGQGVILGYVERVCQYCGKHFTIKANLLKTQTGEYCSQLCGNRAKANPTDSKVRERKANLVSAKSRARWQNPEYQARLSRSQKIAQRKKWENPEFVAKMLASLNRKPTKPEKILIDILNKDLPDFKYNGDFSLGVILGRLIPDFINVNGRKEVIEVLGDYFHSSEVIRSRWQGSELGKVMIYNSLGYKCLVIWEHELKQLTEDEIIDKVKSFFKNKRVRRKLCPNLALVSKRLP